jgi:hypothetical protein
MPKVRLRAHFETGLAGIAFAGRFDSFPSATLLSSASINKEKYQQTGAGS